MPKKKPNNKPRSSGSSSPKPELANVEISSIAREVRQVRIILPQKTLIAFLNSIPAWEGAGGVQLQIPEDAKLYLHPKGFEVYFVHADTPTATMMNIELKKCGGKFVLRDPEQADREEVGDENEWES